jgi:hypothetical protein
MGRREIGWVDMDWIQLAQGLGQGNELSFYKILENPSCSSATGGFSKTHLLGGR